MLVVIECSVDLPSVVTTMAPCTSMGDGCCRVGRRGWAVVSMKVLVVIECSVDLPSVVTSMAPCTSMGDGCCSVGWAVVSMKSCACMELKYVHIDIDFSLTCKYAFNEYLKGAINIQSTDFYFGIINTKFRWNIVYNYLYPWGVVRKLRNIKFFR